jgi:ubiquinone/menaquinone biosynthesis C-methylase UbiE
MADVQRRVWRKLATVAPFQPATNFWRSIELPMLIGALPVCGRGLDLGCGDGALTAILSDLVAPTWELIGIDIEAAEIDLAKGAVVYSQVAVARADQLPLPNACLDFAFANSVLEHLPKLTVALAEIARCLKANGLFTATVPSSAFHECLKGPSALRWVNRTEYLVEMDERLSHFHYLSAEQWTQALEAVGLEVETIRSYFSRGQVELWERWSNWTGGLAYRLSQHRRKPIEIQRSLGLRRRAPYLTRLVSSCIGWLASGMGLHDCEDRSDLNGCFLIRARKKAEQIAHCH